MRYIVFEQQKNGTGDIWNEETNSLSEALEIAKAWWHHLTERERSKLEIFVIESVNPDEDAPDHFDGNPVFTCE